MSRHLLVTNDFPPKVGGIQSYLWELWRRLPPEDVTVLTTAHPDARRWDRQQPFRVVRTRSRVLLPHPRLRGVISGLVREIEAPLVLLDPALPVGLVGPSLPVPYGVVLHGAEVTVPGRLPGARHLLARVLGSARGVVAAGGYPLTEAERALGRPLDAVVVPPGVDTRRFVPLDAARRIEERRRHGLDPGATLVVSVSRLVPRKGMDVLIEAAARVRHEVPRLEVAIAGGGRDRDRLERLIAHHRAPVRLLGRVDDDLLPGLYGCADVFAMLCRNRWFGLEQEGFGIVFLEAAATGVAQVAGNSGGAAEAVAHGRTGLVVEDPRSVDQVAVALRELAAAPERAERLGRAARRRAVTEFSYDCLAGELGAAIGSWSQPSP
jgi:phosphatidyl-myo-inositol dimannoside synthase